MIDLIVLIIIIFFALQGLRQGFLIYLLKLTVIAISLAAAWYYYQQSHQLIKSFLVFSSVFLGLLVLKVFLLGIGQKQPTEKSAFYYANRRLGALTGCIWGTLVAALLIFAVELLPAEQIFKYNIKEKVQASKAYLILNHFIPIKEVNIVENIRYMSKLGPDEKAKLMEQPELKELLESDEFKAVMEDPQTLNQLQNQDLRGLSANRKILELINNGEIMEKMLKLDFRKALED